MATSWHNGLQITQISYAEILTVMVLLVANRCGIFLARRASDHTDILCKDTYSDGAPRSKQMWQLPGTMGFRSHRYLMQRCDDAPSNKQMWHLPGIMGFRSHRYLMQRYLQWW